MDTSQSYGHPIAQQGPHGHPTISQSPHSIMGNPTSPLGHPTAHAHPLSYRHPINPLTPPVPHGYPKSIRKSYEHPTTLWTCLASPGQKLQTTKLFFFFLFNTSSLYRVTIVLNILTFKYNLYNNVIIKCKLSVFFKFIFSFFFNF